MILNPLFITIYFPLFFLLYWKLFSHDFKRQNVLLLFASYLFYCTWNWKFLSLILFSTCLDYLTGIKISESESKQKRKFWLRLSVCLNLGFLFFFKYFNFFISIVDEPITYFGYDVNQLSHKLILPLGISFYTFHGLSYIIDLYHQRIKVERNFIDYALFVSYFPLLIAGPIERAHHLLPQLKVKRIFSYEKSVDGLRQILWGLFKQIIVASVCAEYVNEVFAASEYYSASTHLIAAVLFLFEVYLDFSGYSDIAIGISKLFGIEILRNFNFPLFSKNVQQFWTTWHISLTSWFRDYVYIPLGGSKEGEWKQYRNILIVFGLSGLWHGAQWTFVVWGLLHGLFFVLWLIIKRAGVFKIKLPETEFNMAMSKLFGMITTILIVSLICVFFRATSIDNALEFLKQTFDFGEEKRFRELGGLPFALLTVFIIEWFARHKTHGLENFIIRWPAMLRWSFYLFIACEVILFQQGHKQFIYFQF